MTKEDFAEIHDYFQSVIYELVYTHSFNPMYAGNFLNYEQFEDWFSMEFLEDDDYTNDLDGDSIVYQLSEDFSNGECHIHHGIEKIVLDIRRDNKIANDWVLKIPFLEYDDLSEDEVDIYNCAVDYDFGDFFAEAIWMDNMDFEGVPVKVYIMKKMRMDHTKVARESASMTRSLELSGVKKDNGEYGHMIPALYLHYEEEIVDDLIEFFRDNNIRDLHGSNLGYTNGGRLVLIDYTPKEYGF